METFSKIPRPPIKQIIFTILTETPKNMLKNENMTLEELLKLMNLWCLYEGWESFSTKTIITTLLDMEKEGLVEMDLSQTKIKPKNIAENTIPKERIRIKDIAITVGKSPNLLKHQIRRFRMNLHKAGVL